MPAPADAGPTPERIKALFGDTTLATVRMARGVFPGSDFTSETLAPDACAIWVRDPSDVLIRLSPPAAPRGGSGAAPAGR